MARQEINVVQLFARFAEVCKMLLEMALAIAGENTFAELEEGRRRMLEEEGRKRMIAMLLLGRDLEPGEALPEFKALNDEEAIEYYSHQLVRKYTVAQASRIVGEYRKRATRQGVPQNVPLHYLVPKGFTLKQHAAKAGPCVDNFKYLQDWRFEDVATKKGLVSWIPRLAENSTSKNVDEQRALLAALRQEMNLPEHHLAGFGDVGLLAGLLLAHFKATGERVPLDGYWTRTDARDADGYRLYLNWYGGRLDCDTYHWDEHRRGRIGGVALGVELGL